MKNETPEPSQSAQTEGQLALTLMGMLGHELRTPLQAVMGNVELICMTCHDEAIQEYVQRLSLAANQMNRVLTDVSVFVDVAHKGSSTKREPVVLTSLVQETCAEEMDVAAEKGVEFEVQLLDGTPKAIWGDRVRLEIVIRNLVSNAVKYTATGRVVVTLSMPEPGKLAIEVADTGAGVAKEDLSRVWEPFFRGSNVRRSSKGTGLGLAIVKTIVARLGGVVSLDSEEGRGSKFAAQVPAEICTETRGDKRVLVVSAVKAVGEKLQELGSTTVDVVHTAEDASDAIAAGEYLELWVDAELPAAERSLLTEIVSAAKMASTLSKMDEFSGMDDLERRLKEGAERSIGDRA